IYDDIAFPHAAELFRIADSENAGLCGQAMDFPGDLTCLLPLLNMGKHMLAHELADRAAYHFVGFLKVAGVVVHCCLLHRAFLLFGFVVAFRRFWRKSPGRGGPDREPLGLETEFSLDRKST